MRKIVTIAMASAFSIALMTAFAEACTFCYSDGPGQPIHCESFPGKCFPQQVAAQ
jgi:hypothetical protein